MNRPRDGVPDLPDAVARYISRREALFATATPSAASAQALARATDDAIHELSAQASDVAPGSWTLLALGGYGAGRLLPASDLDLLLLVDDPSSIKGFAQALLYPLWDAGLKVGHQVHTRRDHLKQCREDLDTLTSTLRARIIAGDAEQGHRLLAQVAGDATKRRRRVMAALANRPREGSPYLLEPELKDGAGGQRDLDELDWTACVLAGAPARDVSALTALGLLTDDEFTALRSGRERLAAARWALHLASPRPSERLTLDIAEEIGVDLTGLQSALQDIHHILLSVRERAAGRRETRNSPAPAEVFAAARGGELDLLERWAWEGSLDRFVPGFGELMSLRRPGLAHRYTVGDHCLRAAIIASRPPEDRLGSALFASLPDTTPLIVAALIHDIGKGEPGPGHSARGAAHAGAIARRLGVPATSAHLVAALVEQHLLLAETAASKDIDDEEVVLAAAARLGQRELVAPLYLLAAADAGATGEGAWTTWHAALVGELAARLDAALSSDVEGVGLLTHAEAVREEALSAAGAHPELAAVLHAMPVRYLARRSAAEALAHARAAVRLLQTGKRDAVETLVSSGPIERTWQVTVLALDRPGLFADIAGVLALSGLDILAAEAYPGASGIAIDAFVVRSATLAVPEHSTWSTVERHLTAALGPGFALETRLAEKGRAYGRAGKRRRTQVEVDTSAPYATAITVVAADRLGLLHDVARAIAGSGLDIRWANAFGKDGSVRDTFHVVDADGSPPREPGVLGHVAMRIRERV